MSKRYYVTMQIVVEAESAQAAELLVARSAQDFMGNRDVICEAPGCMHVNKRAHGNPSARIVIEATTDTDEQILAVSPPMITEELGYVEVEGGKPIPGDGRG